MPLRDWWKLARLEHAFLVAVAILASVAVTQKFYGLALTFTPFLIWAALGPFLITAASFVLNDYFGLETDRHNKRRDRPLVSGSIRRPDALKAAAFLYAAGLLVCMGVNSQAFYIALFFAILSVAYDPVLKRLPLAGNVYIASSMGISFLYGNVIVSSGLVFPVLTFFVISFFAGLGRELLITLRDVKGDKKEGMRTLPMLLGPDATVQIASFCFAVALVLLWGFAPWSNGPYIATSLAISALTLWSLRLAFTKDRAQHFKKIRNATLASLALGIVAFATLAL